MRISKILGAVAYAFLALSLSLLGACGGGGGGGGGGASSAKAFTAFSLAGVTATINETTKQIAVTVPNGTDVTSLIATFSADQGATVTIGATAQVSGTTANNFTNPVTYTVTAADTTAATYTVTVIVAANSAKAITAFSLAGVTATINETTKQIAVTVPNGTDVTSLVATFTTTGSGVAIGATEQVSGTTPNNFTSPVTYTVTAADSSTAAYVVTVAIAPSPAKAITAFSLAGVDGVINGTNHTIAVAMPHGTNAADLIATFTTTGASVTVGGVTQVSASTHNDFSSPVTYRVTAADGSTQDYVVTVTVAANPAKAITAFSLAGIDGSLNETAHTITVSMPYGTNAADLIATFTTTGASVTVGGVTQVSASTHNDFSSPVTYRVTAANGSTQDYIVTVNVALNSAKAITAFSLGGVTGSINQIAHTIGVTVPNGTSVTALVADFTITGASVRVGAVTQTSQTTANDFTNPVTYTVIAADSSTQDYVVTVTVAPAYSAFTAGTSLPEARGWHTATPILGSTKVLVAGGFNWGGAGYVFPDTGVVYDVGTGNWTATTNAMPDPRKYHTATLLQDGTNRVLVTGGLGSEILNSATIYDPATNSWTSVTSMGTRRANHTATLISGNRVLVTGGFNETGPGGTQVILATAEIYDVSLDTWTPVATPMSVERMQHTAIALADGRVLVLGGYDGISYLDSVEIFNPTGNTWTTVHPMSEPRDYSPTATLLQNNNVLVIGGLNSNGRLATAEVYNPSTDQWTATGGLNEAREWHTATLLPDGRVLATGGQIGEAPVTVVNTAETYNPATNNWTAIGIMTSVRASHTATLLSNNRVLIVGGSTVAPASDYLPVATVELLY